jgi:hypothetical protein
MSMSIFEWWRMRLEKKRTQALSDITGDQIAFELMVQRSRTANDPIDTELLTQIRAQFTKIEAGAKTSNSISELDDFADDAESQNIARAYFCPVDEIQDEGNRSIDNLALWGIPSSSIEKLRKAFKERLSDPSKCPHQARAALHAIFIEVDEWSDYIDEYEGKMQWYSRLMSIASFVLILIAGASCYFAHVFPLFLWLALVSAGAAGSCASVLAKVPPLDLSLSGELSAYERRIWSRIAAGTVGSLIGISLLGWGVIPITLRDQTFADALSSCGTQASAPCSITKMAIVLGVAMLLGVSERTLTSFEQRVLGEHPNKLTKS